jgi:hypothetical protein
MSVVVFPSQSLRGSQEVLPFDFQSPIGFDTNNVVKPPIMNRAIQNPFSFKAIGCKAEPQTHIVVRRKPLPNLIGTYPQVGVFRHEKKGLAWNNNKPNNLPIMPKASSFWGGGNTTLGTPQ